VFGRLNANDYPTVFGVLAAVLDESCRPTWYRVQLPMRPNGSIGYVRASDVELAVVRTRIAVDLSERRLELFRAGQLVLRAPVAVGMLITPTPTGRYYVNQRLRTADPWGPFGPAALGISAFSPVLQDWTQGGPIAIHGTNDPSSIGKAASHGCIRVRNDVLEVLLRAAFAGTPVTIRA
jgi:lipoprotein-anchoring transpeptidase ErfK/SrfK